MNLNKLRRKIRRQAKRELRAGRMTKREAYRCESVAANDAALQKLNERIENEVNPWNRGLMGADGLVIASWTGWIANAWDWFVANWADILNIILTIAPLLLMETDSEDSQPLATPTARPLQRQQRRVQRVLRSRSGD